MKRREFIRLGAGAMASLPLMHLPSALAGHNQNKRPYKQLGVQLYTIREQLAVDYKVPLKTIASLGYKDLEFAGYFEHKPAEIKRYMDDLGLVSNSTHVRLPALQNDFDSILETAHTMGQTYIVLPWLEEKDRDSLDDYKKHAELLNKRGEQAKSAGFQMAYHNHDFEFIPLDGQLPYDLLLERTDKELVKMQLDLYWAIKANKDPVQYFKKAPGRFPLCHIKDRAADGSITTVGKGSIDFDALFKYADLAGLQHFYVEHDDTDQPFQSLRSSYNYLYR
ncbi:sugar phosphate isomerase/epimerase [Alteromonadaceae bacterium M269]|nr:sugar phosphate isomerase/epimerase [Alteromonadaceae bacterium M269]